MPFLFVLRYKTSDIASQLYFATQSYIAYGSYICLWQVILLSSLAVVVGRTTHFACSVSSYKSTHFFEDGTRGAAATRKGDMRLGDCALVKEYHFVIRLK